MTYYLDRDLKNLASELEQRKKEGRQPVLLLGSYAGGLYRSDYFLYEHVLRNSSTYPHNFTRQQRFKEAHHLLNKKEINEHDINEIMKASFRDLEAEEYDKCLALLIKGNYFHEIISTNIDLTVERSLESVGMREEREFEVFFQKGIRVAGQALSDKTLQPGERGRDYRIIKVFGDLDSREYQINQRFAYFEKRPEFKQFLRKIFEGDILILGLHLNWDEEILHLIPSQGEKLWFVGEEDFSELPLFQSISKAREVQYTMRKYWKFQNISTALYRHLTPYLSTSEMLPTTQPSNDPKEAEGPVKLYFSYADDAQTQSGQLQNSLKRLRIRGLIDDWHRGMINAGEDRQAMRTTRLASAQIILLGISPEFTFSDITRLEAELAMQRYLAEGVIVVPIHLIYVAGWEKESYGHLEALPKDNKPISAYRNRKDRREKVLEDIVLEIENVVARIRLK